jgi:hypothetical protein
VAAMVTRLPRSVSLPRMEDRRAMTRADRPASPARWRAGGEPGVAAPCTPPSNSPGLGDDIGLVTAVDPAGRIAHQVP